MKRVLIENEIIKFISESDKIDTDTKVNYIKTVYNLDDSDIVHMHEQLSKTISMAGRKASTITKDIKNTIIKDELVKQNTILRKSMHKIKELYKGGKISKDKYVELMNSLEVKHRTIKDKLNLIPGTRVNTRPKRIHTTSDKISALKHR